MKRAIFIERDGILNEVGIGPNSPIIPLTLEEFRVKTEAEPALRQLKAAGFVLIVTTHQPGVCHGSLSRGELDRIHDRLRRSFPLDDILSCPHDESDDCPCRTPRPGLLIEAAFKWQANLNRSFVISNKWQDAEAARFAGCTSLLIQSPWLRKAHPDFVLPGLDAIAEKILSFRQLPGLVSSLPPSPPAWNTRWESLSEPLDCGDTERDGRICNREVQTL